MFSFSFVFFFFFFYLSHYVQVVLKLLDCILLGPRIRQKSMDAFSITTKKKRTTGKSDDKIFDQFRDQYPTSSERSEQGDYSKPSFRNGL